MKSAGPLCPWLFAIGRAMLNGSSLNLFDFPQHCQGIIRVVLEAAVASKHIVNLILVGVVLEVSIECDENHRLPGNWFDTRLPRAAVSEKVERPLVLFQVILHVALLIHRTRMPGNPLH